MDAQSCLRMVLKAPQLQDIWDLNLGIDWASPQHSILSFWSFSWCILDHYPVERFHFFVRLQLSDRWSHIIFRHSIIWWRIHSWINDCKLPSPGGSKATPNHPISTIMLHSWQELLLMKRCLWSVPSMSSVAVAKQLYFECACPEYFTPKSPGLWLMFPGKHLV